MACRNEEGQHDCCATTAHRQPAACKAIRDPCPARFLLSHPLGPGPPNLLPHPRPSAQACHASPPPPIVEFYSCGFPLTPCPRPNVQACGTDGPPPLTESRSRGPWPPHHSQCLRWSAQASGAIISPPLADSPSCGRCIHQTAAGGFPESGTLWRSYNAPRWPEGIGYAARGQPSHLP